MSIFGNISDHARFKYLLSLEGHSFWCPPLRTSHELVLSCLHYFKEAPTAGRSGCASSSISTQPLSTSTRHATSFGTRCSAPTSTTCLSLTTSPTCARRCATFERTIQRRGRWLGECAALRRVSSRSVRSFLTCVSYSRSTRRSGTLPSRSRYTRWPCPSSRDALGRVGVIPEPGPNCDHIY